MNKMSERKIDEMPAGRKMDALVAKKVMGHDVHVYECPASSVSRKKGRCCCYPYYSTNIVDAWEVAKKFNTKHRFIELKSTFPTWFTGVFNGHGSNYELIECANADTAPLAICRAALKAIE